ncbi:hypothetical protein [Streptomyces nigra]|uniref:hypothetical protein n=1 Tax=Streptomyces nigra TaxID=1827580 RepID=UPI00363550ED
MSAVAPATPSTGPTFIAACWSPPATPADSTAACRTTPCVAAVITVPKALAARDQDLGPRAKAR